MFERIKESRSAFLRWPAVFQGALIFAAGLLLFIAFGTVNNVSLAAGTAILCAFVLWSLKSLLHHTSRADLAGRSLRQIQDFMNSTSDAVYGIDLEGRCTFCNRACLRLLAYQEASQLLGKDIHALVFTRPGEPDEGARMAAAMREGKNLHIKEGFARRADGSRLPVACWSSLVHDDEKVVGAAVTLSDITVSKAAREAHLQEHDELETQVRELSLHSREMGYLGQLGEMLQACASIEELCKIVAAFSKSLFPKEYGVLYILEPIQLLLDPQATWGEPPLAPPAPFRVQDCWALRRGKPHYQEDPHGDICCAHIAPPVPAFTFCLPLSGQGGTLGLLELRTGAVGGTMSEPRQLVAIALAYQVALGLSNLRLKEILREEAIRDPVTGLFNRRFMQESLDHEIQRAQRTGTSVGVIAFDVDHFKGVNDSLGHAAGDSLLAVLANLAKGGLRAEDISCRQGGDEFLLILPDINEANTLRLAENLRMKAEQFTRLQFPEMAGKVTLSLGLALFPQDAATSKSLQEAADQALYRAKTLGRNRVFAASGLAGMPRQPHLAETSLRV